MNRLVFAGLALALLAAAALQWSCRRTDSPSKEPATPSGPEWFEDVTERMGLRFLHDAGPVGDYFMPQQVGSGAALFDFNNDGRLDIYLLQNGGPNSTSRNRLYQQIDSGHFQDVSAGSGLDIAGHNMDVAVGDVNNDGWPDVLVTQYGGVKLFLNKGDGTFTEEAVLHGLAYNGMGQVQAGMSIAVGDVDGDGLFDIFVTHLTEENNTLWRQGPPGLFRDQSAQAELMEQSARSTGFGTVMADFNDDGALDLAIANGKVAALANVEDWSLGPFWSRYGERNQILRGDGRGRFANISRQNPSLCGWPNVARGLVRGDIDGDGAVDLLVTAIAGPARLYRNIAPKRGHWMQVHAFDPLLKRDALGSVIRLRAGGRTWVGWLHPSESYLCSSEPRVHFGLADVGRIDAIELVWPDGGSEIFDGPHHEGYASDQRLQLRKGQRSRKLSEPRP